MMIRYSFIITLTIFFSLTFEANAQNGNYQMGARSNALGNSSVSMKDGWSLFNNIGALAFTKEHSILLAYHHRFSMNAFSNMAAGYIHPLKNSSVGLSVFQFGDKLFNENKIGLGYSHKINFVSLGLKANRLQYYVENFGSSSSLVIEMGGLVEIHPNLTFGAYVFNLNQAKILKEDNEKIGTLLKAGLSYQPFEELLLNFQLNKDLIYETSFSSGLEYAAIPAVSFRAGVSTQPLINHFGVGFKPKKFEIDYSLVSNQILGLSHQFSIMYKIKSNFEH